MSDLYNKIRSSESVLDKCQVIWDHYLERKLSSGLEPNWVHVGYELVYRALNKEKLSSDQQHLVQEILYTHALKDGTFVPAFSGRPNSPSRLIHDGWKAGTPSWIFMGRNINSNSVKYLGNDWVVVQRTLPEDYYQFLDAEKAPPTLWMAYNLQDKMGLNASTNNVIGPAIYLDQIIHAIQSKIGHTLPAEPIMP
jgi:hypothetical protein